MAKLLGIITPVPSIRFLMDRDALQNEPNIESMQYCNRKLLNVFEDSAQRVCTIEGHGTGFGYDLVSHPIKYQFFYTVNQPLHASATLHSSGTIFLDSLLQVLCGLCTVVIHQRNYHSAMKCLHNTYYKNINA